MNKRVSKKTREKNTPLLCINQSEGIFKNLTCTCSKSQLNMCQSEVSFIQEKTTEQDISSETVHVLQQPEETLNESIARAHELEDAYRSSSLPEGFFISNEKLFYEENPLPSTALD
jgi:hypothetical protein